MGVRILTLTWNRQNELGYGVMTENNNGLTGFGKEVVKKTNNLNMIIDVSHLNESGFWDVYNETEKPFIASHSNVYNICKMKRNLNDEQIKAISKKGGVIGINMYPFFISDSGKSTIKDVLKHIDYILSLIGDDYISLGCDFDGMDITTKGIENVSCLTIFYNELKNLYGEDVSKKITYENSMRLFKKVL